MQILQGGRKNNGTIGDTVIEIIKSYKVVSFDMFDTLILRSVPMPSDIFYVVEMKLNNLKIQFSSFKTKRLEAEKEAVKKGNEEVTIDEIYKCMIRDDKNLRECIKEIEKQTEIQYCVRNKEFDCVIEYCKKNNIPIYILTDMYLDLSTIKAILSRCGVYYDKLYLSSHYQKRKSSGAMYSHVLAENGLHHKDVIHIGDNIKSDFIRPKLMGIKSLLYSRVKYKQSKDFSANILDVYIKNNTTGNENQFYMEGYAALGPLLLGFCQWLHSNIISEKYDQVIFLSRDGYIMQKSYMVLYPEDKSEYAYFSRRSLTVPQLYKASDFKDIVNIVAYIKREETIDTLLHKIGIDNTLLTKELTAKYGNSIDRSKLINGEYVGLFERLQPVIYETSIKEKSICERYLRSIFQGRKVAVVDIGWYGTMQHNLLGIIKDMHMDVDIYGYYIGYLGNKYSDIEAKGYIFDVKAPLNACKKDLLFGFNGLIETFFTADHGSVKNYMIKDEQVVPVLEKWEEENWEAVSQIHAGSLAFLSDIKKIGIITLVPPETAWHNMGKLLIYPDSKQLKIFGNLLFYDASIEPLIKYAGMQKYLTNPGQLKKDLLSSNWKLGFLTKLFRILPFSASRLYLLLEHIK